VSKIDFQGKFEACCGRSLDLAEGGAFASGESGGLSQLAPDAALLENAGEDGLRLAA